MGERKRRTGGEGEMDWVRGEGAIRRGEWGRRRNRGIGKGERGRRSGEIGKQVEVERKKGQRVRGGERGE